MRSPLPRPVTPPALAERAGGNGCDDGSGPDPRRPLELWVRLLSGHSDFPKLESKERQATRWERIFATNAAKNT